MDKVNAGYITHPVHGLVQYGETQTKRVVFPVVFPNVPEAVVVEDIVVIHNKSCRGFSLFRRGRKALAWYATERAVAGGFDIEDVRHVLEQK